MTETTLGTVVVLIVLAAIVSLSIYSMIRDKKKGKSPTCGFDCSKCKGCH
jgi:hypothetical protein